MQLGIHRHGDESRVPAGEKDLVVLRAILHRQGDSVASLQVQSGFQASSELRYAMRELTIRKHGSLAERDGARVRQQPSASQQ
jgi:hypothetical protein